MKKNLKSYRLTKSVKDTVFIKAGGKCSYTNCLVNLVSDERNYQMEFLCVQIMPLKLTKEPALMIFLPKRFLK